MTAAATVREPAPSLRRVRRARLRPARAADAARLRFAVEDGLRTAEFGDCGRLVLVRRLRLRGLPPGADGPILARAFETAWRATAQQAVAADCAGAARADAVWFGSATAAALAWLRRAVAGPAPDAWYWTAAVPEAKAPAGEGAAQAVAAVVARLWQHERAALLAAWRTPSLWPDADLAALGRRLPTALLRTMVAAAERGDGPPSDPGGPARRSGTAGADRVSTARAVDDADASGRPTVGTGDATGRPDAPQDEVSRWLAMVQPARDAHGPDAGAEPWRPARPDGGPPRPPPAARAGRGPAPDAGGAGIDAAGGMPSARPSPVDPGAGWIADPMCSASTAATDATVAAPGARADAPAPAGASVQPADLGAASRPRLLTAAWPWLAGARCSEHAGLLLLLNALPRLRFDAWLATQPDAAAFTDRLFIYLLDRCGAPADDPQRAWFAAGADGGPTADPRCRAWALRLRRALRGASAVRPRLDLDALVGRRGWVVASATHLDIVFPLDAVDLRLRRLGLDQDPGWVPWFGRIVGLHFLPAHQLPPVDPGLDAPAATAPGGHR